MTTDTNQASELFELCKKVYEKTGWKYTIGRFHDDGSYDGYVGHRGVAYTPNPQDAEWLPKDIPLYTSDYLLEMLPVGIQLYKGARGWTVNVGNSLQHSEGVYEVIREDNFKSDTPLKALLKLTIALSEAGELNDQSS